jgi:hypothetical protein
MTTETKRIILFSNSSEYYYWAGRNCEQCSKSSGDDTAIDDITCGLEKAVVTAAVEDGLVDDAVYQKIKPSSGGNCIEFVAGNS